MSLDVLLRVLKQHLLWFILLPAATGGMAWYATRNQPSVYKSSATLYTGLASGYSLLSDRQTAFIDRSATAFDNLLTTLLAKETLIQVGERLLADHLRLQRPDSLVLGAAGFSALRQAVLPDYRAQLLANGGKPARLRLVLDSLVKSPFDNPVKRLILNSDSPYSVGLLADKLKATARKSTNDVLQMDYEAADPAVAQQTLRYAIDVLNERYSTFKTSETNSVVGYYETKLKRAKQELDRAEAALRAFNVNHQVLDYNEEARTVATSREALTTSYNQELMRQRAAKAALDALNRRMGQSGGLNRASADLSVRQKKLTEAESQLANARAYGQPKAVIARLQAAVAQAADALKVSAQTYDAAVDSPESVPQQTLANDRLAKQLEYEESTARLQTYQKQMDDYAARTSAYSPLGSQLRQLERQLSVAEKEYLTLLQSVDQSRTRRQDVAVGGRLDVMDAPDFPLAPLASKRWQLVGVGAGVGLFLALLLTALRAWLDKRIHSPAQAEELIGLPITAVFPSVRKPGRFSRTSQVARRLFEQLFNAVNVEVSQVTSKPYPPLLTLFSVRPGQGKTWVADGLAGLYADADQQVAYCYPRPTAPESRPAKNGVTYFPYTVRPDFLNVTGVEYLLDHQQPFDATQYDRILLELPSLIDHQIPAYLLKNSALSLLIVDAGSAWGRAEQQLLNLYRRVTNQPVLTVLNRVGGDYVDGAGRAGRPPAANRPEGSPMPQRNEL